MMVLSEVFILSHRSDMNSLSRRNAELFMLVAAPAGIAEMEVVHTVQELTVLFSTAYNFLIY